MKTQRSWRLATGLLFAAAVSSGFPGQASAKISKSELKAVLEKNPDIIFDFLRDNSTAFFDLLRDLSMQAREREMQAQEKAQEKEIVERIKDPYKPQIESWSMVRGDKSAPYTLVEYSDFQCPYCSQAERTVDALRAKYGKKMRLIYKNNPLPMHPQAMPAARYLVAAALQSKEKAWKFHDWIFAHQQNLGQGDAFFEKTAKQFGLNFQQMKKDAQSDKVKKRVQADMDEAQKFGLMGTPGFLINGVPVKGAYPVAYFESIIQKIQKIKGTGKT